VIKQESCQAGAENAEARSAEVLPLEVRSTQWRPKPEKRGRPSPSWRDGNEERPVGDVTPSASSS
jgi:hypothetical protein